MFGDIPLTINKTIHNLRILVEKTRVAYYRGKVSNEIAIKKNGIIIRKND